jgi:hypothetical protein
MAKTNIKAIAAARNPAFVRGFERACLLILGANRARWKAAERKLYNRVTRMLFGRKRQATCPHCTHSFKPHRQGQKYCGPRCSNNAKQKRFRRRFPDLCRMRVRIADRRLRHDRPFDPATNNRACLRSYPLST